MATEKSATPAWKQYNRNLFIKFLLAVWGYIKGVGWLLWSVIKAIPRKFVAFFVGIGRCFRGLWFRFIHGDWRTKLSYLIMGFGCFSRGPKQFLKGFLLLLVEALFVVFMVLLGGPNLAMLGSLGKNTEGYDDDYNLIKGDNSLTILIFCVMSFILIIFFVYVYIKNTKIAYDAIYSSHLPTTAMWLTSRIIRPLSSLPGRESTHSNSYSVNPTALSYGRSSAGRLFGLYSRRSPTSFSECSSR